MRRAPVAVVAALATLASAGCGEPSAEEYRAELNAACTTFFDGLESLPARAAEEDLAVSDLQEVGDEIAGDYAERLADLDPPAGLAEAHDELLSFAEDPPDDVSPEALLATLEETTDAYATLGVGDCEQRSQNNLDNLRDSLEAVRDVTTP